MLGHARLPLGSGGMTSGRKGQEAWRGAGQCPLLVTLNLKKWHRGQGAGRLAGAGAGLGAATLDLGVNHIGVEGAGGWRGAGACSSLATLNLEATYREKGQGGYGVLALSLEGAWRHGIGLKGQGSCRACWVKCRSPRWILVTMAGLKGRGWWGCWGSARRFHAILNRRIVEGREPGGGAGAVLVAATLNLQEI